MNEKVNGKINELIETPMDENYIYKALDLVDSIVDVDAKAKGLNLTEFNEVIDYVESILINMKEVRRRETQYDEEIVLTMTASERDLILKQLRILERTYYRK